MRVAHYSIQGNHLHPWNEPPETPAPDDSDSQEYDRKGLLALGAGELRLSFSDWYSSWLDGATYQR